MNEKWARNLHNSNISGPSLGDPKLHSKNLVLHPFGSILTSLKADYGQIIKITKNVRKIKKYLQIFIFKCFEVP